MARCGDTYARQASSLDARDYNVPRGTQKSDLCSPMRIHIYLYIYMYMDVRMDMKESVCMCKGEREKGKTEKLTSHRPVD